MVGGITAGGTGEATGGSAQSSKNWPARGVKSGNRGRYLPSEWAQRSSRTKENADREGETRTY